MCHITMFFNNNKLLQRRCIRKSFAMFIGIFALFEYERKKIIDGFLYQQQTHAYPKFIFIPME